MGETYLSVGIFVTLSHFTLGNSEAQRGEATGPRSHSLNRKQLLLPPRPVVGPGPLRP